MLASWARISAICKGRVAARPCTPRAYGAKSTQILSFHVCDKTKQTWMTPEGKSLRQSKFSESVRSHAPNMEFLVQWKPQSNEVTIFKSLLTSQSSAVYFPIRQKLVVPLRSQHTQAQQSHTFSRSQSQSSAVSSQSCEKAMSTVHAASTGHSIVHLLERLTF